MRLFAVRIVIVALLVATVPASLFAMAGKLDTPSLSFDQNYPASSKALVMKALNRADCKFLGGSFVNWMSTLRYGGGSDALNGFISDLTKCPNATINIRFRKDLGDADWVVSHTPSDGERFDILINANSKRVQLDALLFPEYKSR